MCLFYPKLMLKLYLFDEETDFALCAVQLLHSIYMNMMSLSKVNIRISIYIQTMKNIAELLS